MNPKTKNQINQALPWLLTFVRIVIGWHFLYEGISKISAEAWSSAPYLAGSRWVFGPMFNAMAENGALTAVIDFMNIWGMTLIGAGLILGLFTRWASAGGAIMLLFYFLAYPPFPGYMFGVPVEGSYLWVNRNLIELFILTAFIFVAPGYLYSIDRLYANWKDEKARRPVPDQPENKEKLERREIIKNLISFPVLGAFAYALYKKRKWDSFEDKLLEVEGINASSGATLLKFN